MDNMEKKAPYATPPFLTVFTGDHNGQPPYALPQIHILTSGSLKRGILGLGLTTVIGDKITKSISITTGKPAIINLYFTQLGAILEAIKIGKEDRDR